MSRIELLLKTVYDIIGIDEATGLDRTKDAPIKLKGSAKQLINLIDAFGVQAIPNGKDAKAMTYSQKLNAFIIKKNEFVTVVFPHPVAGCIALHFEGKRDPDNCIA